ncbi:hypothetical protein, partial [Roseburia sp. AM59-24XD]|uniref:hypothetical protein n=1 Tax=Roseburia sp. AM59-24XD TaxID=2293138 RepID=UPI001314FDD1
PVGKHGRLHLAKVDGYGNAPVIVDQYGKPFQMRGASTMVCSGSRNISIRERCRRSVMSGA